MSNGLVLPGSTWCMTKVASRRCIRPCRACSDATCRSSVALSRREPKGRGGSKWTADLVRKSKQRNKENVRETLIERVCSCLEIQIQYLRSRHFLDDMFVPHSGVKRHTPLLSTVLAARGVFPPSLFDCHSPPGNTQDQVVLSVPLVGTRVHKLRSVLHF